MPTLVDVPPPDAVDPVPNTEPQPTFVNGNGAHDNDANGHGHDQENRNDGDEVDELCRLGASINTGNNVTIGDEVLDNLRRENIEAYKL